MLSNATLISIASRTANAAGKKLFGNATLLSGRCWLDVPTHAQLRELGATVEDAQAVAMIPKSSLPPSMRSGDGPARGSKLTLRVDQGEVVDHEVVRSVNRQKDGGLAHFEVYLQVLRT